MSKIMLMLVNRIANRLGLAVLLLVYLGVFGMILMTMRQLATVTGGAGILDFERGYSRERVVEILGSYGSEGFDLYARIQMLDLVNPAIYGLFLASLMALLWRNRQAQWVVLLPLVAGALDYAENLTIYLMINRYPDIPDGLVAVSSALSLIKNGAMAATVLAFVVGLVLLVLRRRTA